MKRSKLDITQNKVTKTPTTDAVWVPFTPSREKKKPYSEYIRNFKRNPKSSTAIPPISNQSDCALPPKEVPDTLAKSSKETPPNYGHNGARDTLFAQQAEQPVPEQLENDASHTENKLEETYEPTWYNRCSVNYLVD